MRDVTPLLVATDVAAATAFYVEKLGFTKEFAFPADKPTFATVKRGNVRFMLESPASYTAKGGVELANGPRGEGVELYITLTDDIDGYYNEVVQAGAEIVRPIFTTEYGMRQFSLRDACGYMLTFIMSIAVA